jgi:hypothetical protein
VEQELRAADLSRLTLRQRANRAHHIEVLRRYREQGEFPHNHVVSDRRVPVFIDPHGTHCAVGHLMAMSGASGLARRISASRNLARVPELADLPEVVAWLEDAGLTLDEAARVQPTYGPVPPYTVEKQSNYPAATLVTGGIGALAGTWNLVARRQGSAWWVPGALGIGVGLAGSGLAVYGVSERDSDDDISDTLIGVNAAVGLLSGILGSRTLMLGRVRTAGTDEGTDAASLSVSPWTARNGGAGVHLALRF